MSLPYDGFFNGNIDLMIEKGTYPDFRHVVLKGLKNESEIKKYDEQWKNKEKDHVSFRESLVKDKENELKDAKERMENEMKKKTDELEEEINRLKKTVPRVEIKKPKKKTKRSTSSHS